MVPLEKMFDQHDRYKQREEVKEPQDHIEVNIGLEANPKLIQIGKGTTPEERKWIENLI